MKSSSPPPQAKTLRGRYGSGLDTPYHSMLGLHALVSEMGEQGVAPATLLQGTGLAADQLVDEVRRHVASEYLRKSVLGVEEIAARVGYSDASNFRKAFKRWTSVSPAHYRAHAAPPPGRREHELSGNPG